MSKNKMITFVDLRFSKRENKVEVDVTVEFPNIYGKSTGIEMIATSLVKAKAKFSHDCPYVKRHLLRDSKCKHFSDNGNIDFTADTDYVRLSKTFVLTYDDRKVLEDYLFSDEFKKQFSKGSGITRFYVFDENMQMLSRLIETDEKSEVAT